MLEAYSELNETVEMSPNKFYVLTGILSPENKFKVLKIEEHKEMSKNTVKSTVQLTKVGVEFPVRPEKCGKLYQV